ncbi:peptidoglycan-binding protein, partial [Streptomyces sp. NPDC001508]|uniref:peptidoglycan-binding protein n=1 Tax=Streptomyces sp. NPDC001508 TaxID=3154656 RepID=UPI00331A96EE
MSLRSRTSRRARLVLASAVAGGIALTGITALGAAPATAVTATKVSAEGSRQAAPITRAKALLRAASWLTANNGSQVPYSQARNWRDGYRQDCSGFVSMALGLKGSPNTVGLASDRSLTRRITVDELRAGDLLIDAQGNNNTRHVVMFDRWTDETHTAYWAYEQRGHHGTDHRVLKYGLNRGSEYKPYRAVNIRDSGTTPTTPSKGPNASRPELKLGSMGASVKTLQKLLNAVLGSKLEVDGEFGPDTEAAVKNFQRARGLTVDGEVGPQTWRALVGKQPTGSGGAPGKAPAPAPGKGSGSGSAPAPGKGSGTGTAPTPGKGSGTGTAPTPGKGSGTGTAPTPGKGSGTGT